MNKKENELFEGCKSGNIEIVKKALTSGILSPKANVNVKNENGVTPLMIAAQNGFLEIVNILITNEASINESSKGEMTALKMAAYNGNVDVTKLLIEKGATGFNKILKTEFKNFTAKAKHELLQVINIINQKISSKDTMQHIFNIGFRFDSQMKGLFADKKSYEDGVFYMSENGLLALKRGAQGEIIAIDYIQISNNFKSRITLIKPVDDEHGEILFNDIMESL